MNHIYVVEIFLFFLKKNSILPTGYSSYYSHWLIVRCLLLENDFLFSMTLCILIAVCPFKYRFIYLKYFFSLFILLLKFYLHLLKQIFNCFFCIFFVIFNKFNNSFLFNFFFSFLLRPQLALNYPAIFIFIIKFMDSLFQK